MNEQFKILVVDDNPEMLSLSTMILERAGYDILEATSGRDCLNKVQTHHPDLVLLDVILPDITGTEICRQIKADKNLEDIFVILVSGIQVSSEHQAEGLNIGADAYIVRPIPNKEFLARIQAGERIKVAEDGLREKEKQQQVLISQLKEALAEIKTLKGFIPICSLCKKIRNDKGYWDNLETYISKHTNAIFSHGLCPTCAEKYKSEIKNLQKNR